MEQTSAKQGEAGLWGWRRESWLLQDLWALCPELWDPSRRMARRHYLYPGLPAQLAYS